MIWVYIIALVIWTLFLIGIFSVVKTHPSTMPIEPVDQKINVVIAFRNEGQKLMACLSALSSSRGVSFPLRVIMVDDDSTDDSLARIEEARKQFSNLDITVLSNEGSGKKSALKTGLKKVDDGWIDFTDADCQVQESTIASMVKDGMKEDVAIVFGPVVYSHSNAWERWLAYENLNTQMVSEAFVKIKAPVMVNGGNMLVHSSKKDGYQESLQMDYASGDDVFFAQSASKAQFTGSYKMESAVLTDPPSDLHSLLSQRIRWASKYAGYGRPTLRLLPPFIFLVNVIFLWLTIDWLFLSSLFNALTVLWVAKSMIEFSFHRSGFDKYRFNAEWWDGLLISLVYPLYFIVIGLAGLMSPSFQWKGRRYKH